MSKKSPKLKMTPKDWESLAEQIDKQLQRPYWIQIGVLKALKSMMENLSDADQIKRLFEVRSYIHRMTFQWHPHVSNGDYWYRPQRSYMLDRSFSVGSDMCIHMCEYSAWFGQTSALCMMTKEAVCIVEAKECLRLPPERLRDQCFSMPQVEREDFLAELFRPVSIVLFLNSPRSGCRIDVWRRIAREEREWDTSVVLEGNIIPVTLWAVVNPMVNDKDAKEAYFELQLSLSDLFPELDSRGICRADVLVKAWNQLTKQIKQRIKYLEDVSLGRSSTIDNPFAQVEENTGGKQAVMAPAEEKSNLPPASQPEAMAAVDPLKPRWDKLHRNLFVGNDLIKHFKRFAPNQQRILDAFELEGWPERIDDPLPFRKEEGDFSQQDRLENTIKSLNKSIRRSRRLHFKWVRGNSSVFVIVGDGK